MLDKSLLTDYSPKKIKGQIQRKQKALAEAEQKLQIATDRYNQNPNRLNEADMVIANSNVVNLRAELFLLTEKQQLIIREFALANQQAQPGNE